MSHYPAAYKPPPGTKPKIERDDFPAPPYPYTDPGTHTTVACHVYISFEGHRMFHLTDVASLNVSERRRRWSDTYKGVADSDDEADGNMNGKLNGHVDPKLRREEHELAKIETGIAQVLS